MTEAREINIKLPKNKSKELAEALDKLYSGSVEYVNIEFWGGALVLDGGGDDPPIFCFMAEYDDLFCPEDEEDNYEELVCQECGSTDCVMPDEDSMMDLCPDCLHKYYGRTEGR